ncbi:MAG: DUF542 domain-containing protein [Pseudohongiellaceae bacterium]
MSTFTDSLRHHSLGELAVMLPGATAVFRQLGLDYCCRGDLSLVEEARLRGIPLEKIESELEPLMESSARSVPDDPVALIDHLVTVYHARIRDQLPELIRLARKVEYVHRDHPAVPASLAEELELLREQLDAQMASKEEKLFPALLAGDRGAAERSIARVRYEHRNLGERLHRLERLTGGGQPPADACASWQALYGGVRSLVDDLVAQVHLENNGLFPRFTRKQPG